MIRVFGVYKHGEINAQFWETVGHQLNRLGAEYRKRSGNSSANLTLGTHFSHRCNFRNKASYQRGEYAILPEEFARLSSGPEEEVVTSPTNDSTDLTKEDMESVRDCHELTK